MVRGRLAALLIALRLALAAPLAPPRTAVSRPVELVIIVHPDVPVVRLRIEDVRRIYLLRMRFWSGAQRIAPANLAPGSPLREAFSRAVLGQSTRDLAPYWNELYFHGTLPPPSLESEAAMLLYVARTPGAVGYVSRPVQANAPLGVREVLSVEATLP